MGKSSDQETLRALRNPRGVAIAGILFAVVFAISIILLRSALPKEPFADVEWVRQEAGRMRVALFLIPFAGIFFLWFMGVVREYMGNLGDWFFSTLLIGSGVLFLAMIICRRRGGGSHCGWCSRRWVPVLGYRDGGVRSLDHA